MEHNSQWNVASTQEGRGDIAVRSLELIESS